MCLDKSLYSAHYHVFIYSLFWFQQGQLTRFHHLSFTGLIHQKRFPVFSVVLFFSGTDFCASNYSRYKQQHLGAKHWDVNGESWNYSGTFPFISVAILALWICPTHKNQVVKLMGRILQIHSCIFQVIPVLAGPDPAFNLHCAVPSMSLRSENKDKICCVFVHGILKCLLLVRKQ